MNGSGGVENGVLIPAPVVPDECRERKEGVCAYISLCPPLLAFLALRLPPRHPPHRPVHAPVSPLTIHDPPAMSAVENEKASVQEKQDAASSSSGSIRHIDTVGNNVNAILANPLEGIPHEKLMANAARFARAHGMEHLTEDFQKGALVAQDPAAFESLTQLNEDDKNLLRRELTHKWDQPWELYYLVILCSIAAAVQGVRPAIY